MKQQKRREEKKCQQITSLNILIFQVAAINFLSNNTRQAGERELASLKTNARTAKGDGANGRERERECEDEKRSWKINFYDFSLKEAVHSHLFFRAPFRKRTGATREESAIYRCVWKFIILSSLSVLSGAQ